MPKIKKQVMKIRVDGGLPVDLGDVGALEKCSAALEAVKKVLADHGFVKVQTRTALGQMIVDE